MDGTTPVNPSISVELRDTITSINRLTHGVVCQRRDVQGTEKPGVQLALGSYGTSAEHPDTFARRVQHWLHSKHADTLRAQLATEPQPVERHAVLVFDPEVEPGTQTAAEQGTDFCPTEPLDLPDEVDVLWPILGPVACRYSTATGWQALARPEAAQAPPTVRALWPALTTAGQPPAQRGSAERCRLRAASGSRRGLGGEARWLASAGAGLCVPRTGRPGRRGGRITLAGALRGPDHHQPAVRHQLRPRLTGCVARLR